MRDLHERVSALVVSTPDEASRMQRQSFKLAQAKADTPAPSPAKHSKQEESGGGGSAGSNSNHGGSSSSSLAADALGYIGKLYRQASSERGVLRREDTMPVKAAMEARDPVQRRRSSGISDTRKCTLTCFTPDGSPLQGQLNRFPSCVGL